MYLSARLDLIPILIYFRNIFFLKFIYLFFYIFAVGNKIRSDFLNNLNLKIINYIYIIFILCLIIYL